ncbi:hypothetical protein PHLGIDRAFT_69908 [Phlebiopsis gigantea 11061_1 CR5-6]|uniref:Alternative oxidase n=1 Tax=Phlebiopsis gigantea (strain 11061_1 CR5-6) TaxID=745531 RepID=A0A0C3S993_PHLG1|nr:hypothetical protein PHLGIDRAFT_69908 [Phlebiopsis gigantea 11061_1 CR5-6]
MTVEKVEVKTGETLIKTDDASLTPQIHGDWVLFHPVYTDSELHAVKVIHREPTTLSDKVARALVKTARKCFDLVSGYREKTTPPPSGMSLQELRKQGYALTEQQWLQRILFLETIAGVPGMVAAVLRHLRSLRLMRRDAGWIHTLLEEAENERMHLMTFMTIRKPSVFFRALVLGAQGVFYNAFFLSYLFSPRVCHRFVAYLEEEAVHTYTRCIKDLESGRIPEWCNFPAPGIAKDYWRLKPNATLVDVLYAVRSDESTHRFVNHSLANLHYTTDINPFALREPDMHVKGTTLGFERAEAEEYVQESRKLLDEQNRAAHNQ